MARLRVDRLVAEVRRRSAFGFDVMTLAGGMTIAQGIFACATPFLTRFYSVDDFGQLQTYLAIYAFAFVIVAWRYELAVLLPESDEMSAAVVVVALLVVVLMSVVGAITVAVVPWTAIVPPSYRFLQPYRWLWPVTLIGGGTYLVVSQWALRRGAYPELMKTRITQTTGQVGAQLLLAGHLHPGIWGLLIGDAFGRSAGSLRLIRVLWKHDGPLFRQLRFATLRQAARRYSGFPLISSASAVVNTAGFAVPTLMLGSLFGTQVLGWYALVDRVLGVPSVLIGTAASQAYTARAARLANSDLHQAKRLFRRMVLTMSALGVAPYAVLLGFGPPLFAVVFGASWREAGEYATLLAIPQFVAFVASTVMPTLNLLERQGWQLAWDGSRLVLACGSLYVVARMTGNARTAIAAYGVSMFVAYVAHGLLSYGALRRAKVTDRVAPSSAA